LVFAVYSEKREHIFSIPQLLQIQVLSLKVSVVQAGKPSSTHKLQISY